MPDTDVKELEARLQSSYAMARQNLESSKVQKKGIMTSMYM
jgi:hypothetical protein